MSFNSTYKPYFLQKIISILYDTDLQKLQEKKVHILTTACSYNNFTSGAYIIYYEGESYAFAISNTRIDIEKPIHFDLQEGLAHHMDKYLHKLNHLETEIHDVRGLLRSVLNASMSVADINALMPKQIKRKCPNLFESPFDALTLTDDKIAEFKLKHNKMLTGLKQKVMRDLLLRQK